MSTAANVAVVMQPARCHGTWLNVILSLSFNQLSYFGYRAGLHFQVCVAVAAFAVGSWGLSAGSLPAPRKPM